LVVAATVAAQLWLSVNANKAKTPAIRVSGRIFFMRGY